MNITKKNNCIEIIFFIIFCISVIILSLFHEPWFDEFQAWGISKDSIYNILFVIPHFEGHPPLWYLILKCFSHFNVNCELGIKIPNLLFMFAAVWLLIFKSPFPIIVRLTLPFTYFLFYQYSIISRPYSIFCFAIFLAAVFYKERNEHPFKFVFALALLCLSSAYGMVISAGIILAWFVQILSGGGYNAKKKLAFVKDLIKDKCFHAMFLIFLLCLLLSFIIYPDKNVLYSSGIQPLSPVARFFSTFFIIPSDTLVLNILMYNCGNKLDNNPNIFLLGVCIGVLINILFFYIFKSYKKLLYFFIPYLVILIIFFRYVAPHHTGLLTAFYIFIFWCITSEHKKHSSKILNKILIPFIIIVITVQIYWSVIACINEIKYPYSVSRNMAEFIKKNGINNYNILPKWQERTIYRNKNTGEIIAGIPIKNDIFIKNWEKKIQANLRGQNLCVSINPYFNKNIFYSFNIDAPEKEYTVFKKMSIKETEKTKQIIKEKGLPDFILNQANLGYIFSDEELKNVNYLLLNNFFGYKIWKDSYNKSFHSLYIREDLYKKLTEKRSNEKN